MNSNSKFIRIAIGAAVALMLCSVAQADILYDLPLPFGPGVNTATNPVNNAYTPAENIPSDLFGGDVYNSTGVDWHVNSLTVWAVGYTSAGPNGTGTAFPNPLGLTLYGGVYGGVGSPITPVGTTFTDTLVQYASSSNGALNYLSSDPPDPTYYNIWAVTFTGLNLTIAANSDYLFGVQPVGVNPELRLHVTSACVSSETCNSFGVVDFAPGVGNYTAANFYPQYGDVNIELQGTATPEPTTWMLFGVGIGVLGLVRRRRG